MGCCASTPPPTAAEYTQAVKDVLAKTVTKTVNQVGKPGGYFNNPNIKIPIPTALGDFCRELADFSDMCKQQVAEFEQKLNGAAEKAVANSLDVFVNHVNTLNFADAKALIQGAADGGTNYFKSLEDKDHALETKFRPIVNKAMEDEAAAGVLDATIQLYKMASEAADAAKEGLAAGMNMLGLGDQAPKVEKKEKPPCDLEQYVAQEALEGLWKIMRQFEADVRKNTADYSPMMKKCFAPQK